MTSSAWIIEPEKFERGSSGGGVSWCHAGMAHGDFIMRDLGQKATRTHVTGGFQQFPG
jgi:hypothetical protein